MAMSGAVRFDETKVGSYTVRYAAYGEHYETAEFNRTLGCFCYVLRGHVVETQLERVWEMPTAALVFHPLGPVRRFVGTNLSCTSMFFDLGSITSKLDGPLPFDRKLVLTSGAAIAIGTRFAKEVVNLDKDSPLAIEELLWEMAALAARKKFATNTISTAPSWLRLARDLVRSGEKLTLEAIAREVGTHPVHLSRSFHRHFGLTMSDYARQVRLRRACRALTDPQANISDIAFEAGFADHSQFTRHFRQALGVTPTEYRRLIR
jgi:AraC family transcriptional regulator